MSKLRIGFALLVAALVVPLAAQVSGPPHVFVGGTVINPDEMNLNFSTIYGAALNRGGGTMTGALTGTSATFSGAVTGASFTGSGSALTGILETAITDGSIFPRLAGNETVTGVYVFTAEPQISNAFPSLILAETGVAANNGKWRVFADSSVLSMQTVDDAVTTSGTAFSVTRVGVAPQVFVLGTGISYTAVITPSALASGDNNNYSPTGLGATYTLRLQGDGANGSVITGIAGGTSGRVLVICNVGTDTFQWDSEDAASTAANRGRFGSGGVGVLTYPPNLCQRVMYDSTLQRWLQAF